MKRKSALAAALLCAGCVAKAPKVAVVPAAPVPASDPPALIFPQTVLELPDPQPVPPEAIPKRDTPAAPQVTETSPARTTPRHSTTTASAPTPASEPAKPATSAPPATHTQLVPMDDSLPNSDMIQKRIDALKSMQARLSSKTGGDAEMIRSRILYFIDQAGKALARKDLRQADSLVSRAQVLAEDLLGVR